MHQSGADASLPVSFIHAHPQRGDVTASGALFYVQSTLTDDVIINTRHQQMRMGLGRCEAGLPHL
ncbi:hypothetical protein ACJ1_36490 [Pantoea sp. QMID1]|nr:hypothetical protein ACJ1_36490 [Pantoea sp. QMID1]